MLTPWLELPGAADRLATWSEISGLDLVRLGTTASAEEITDTAVTQPLVVAATLLAHEEAVRRGLLTTGPDTIVAGHSVGEIAAYAIAGVISADDAVKLAATRGAEMARACAVEPTGMSAVLGGDEAEVLARLEALELTPANRNAAGQIVAAGAAAGHRRRVPHPLHGPGAGRLHGGRAGRVHRRADDDAAVQRRRAAGGLGRRCDGEAGGSADPAGAVGPVHRHHTGA
jgi:[acyl-carrier-protein] S-malonyltransferase